VGRGFTRSLYSLVIVVLTDQFVAVGRNQAQGSVTSYPVVLAQKDWCDSDGTE